MSKRKPRVEELLRREIAQMLLRGDVRDPRLADTAAISVTGARMSADLGTAVVFVDVLATDDGTRAIQVKRVLTGLNAAAGTLRAALGRTLRLRRTPTIRFEEDTSIVGGARIEALLSEIRGEGSPGSGEDG
jgi:ribosome-binding factor A